TEPKSKRYDDQRERKFLAEGGLLAKCAHQPVDARTQRTHHADDAARLVATYGCAVGFHVRSGCRAAPPSSGGRTGLVCGALVTRPGSCSASCCIWDIAVTKASRTSLLSVSVGSMSRHSGTSSGK